MSNLSISDPLELSEVSKKEELKVDVPLEEGKKEEVKEEVKVKEESNKEKKKKLFFCCF